jgi:hypothetical protein
MALTQQNAQSPSYFSRQGMVLGSNAAGSGGATSKFVAYAQLQLFSINLLQQVLSTSTYTVGGVGTGTISIMQMNLIIVQNTSTTTTAALSTTTIGPFYAGGSGTVGQLNVYNQYALNTTTGTQGQGGVLVPQGALVYAITGTDATAVAAVTVDYQAAVGAPLTI